MLGQTVLEKLQPLKKFYIHTGNVNQHGDLKLQRFANSAEEFKACLSYLNIIQDSGVNEHGVLLLNSNSLTETPFERDDLKITLKIFLQEFDFTQIEKAVEGTLRELNTDNIEQLIVSFPMLDYPENVKTEEEEDKLFITEVMKLWKELEEFVKTHKVTNLGVADFSLNQLTQLFDQALIKPCVNHFNIDACCVVPPELHKYASENDIQLLTHNDPAPFPVAEAFKEICALKCTSATSCGTFHPTWAARYTAWVRRRSLMAAKGYIIEFTGEQEQTNH
uniref:GCS light chain n=1 Tax=Rhabditophanes sp. KR3021 TaxID=114890 RepID=A0AC35U8V8_9BILA